MSASSDITTADKIRGLPWSIASIAFNTVFVQFIYFGPVFVLFLSELGIRPAQIGFLLSLFPFMGLVALFIAPAVARYGYKRTYVTFWGIRKVITALLVFVPWVVVSFGTEAAVVFITFIVAGFGLCRAIAETGYYPWVQEFVPDSVRGKYTASTNLYAGLVGVVAVTFASFVLEQSDTLERFTFLFGLGVVAGVISVWLVAHVPGGAPVQASGEDRPRYRDLPGVLKDRNLILFLLGFALVTFATGPLYSFLPLYMQEQVGLSEGNIVFLQNAALIGGLLVTYLIGWSADRYGSQPVMMVGLAVKVLLPVGWLLMPRGSELSLPVALAIALFQGASNIAWAVGSGRLLFVSVIPARQRGQYMPVYYAAIGIIGGSSQVIGGRVVDASADISGTVLGLTLDPYTPLMLAGIVLLILSLLVFRQVRRDSSVGVTEFATMFMQGNPIVALESMVRYYRARDEKATVAMTERMGQAKSPLAVDEMIEALGDPRFNVRFEAVISIARTMPHPRLIEALGEKVNGTELSLSGVSAWALGRLGDERAISPLREGLDSDYKSIRAHCARALGTLHAVEVIPVLRERLQTETDRGLQMAYASALGNLGAAEAVGTLLALLVEMDNEGARLELALSLGRLSGEEQHFIRLLRAVRQDVGTAIAQEMAAIRGELGKLLHADLRAILDDCTHAFAHQDVDGGIEHLRRFIVALPQDQYAPASRAILAACVADFATPEPARIEYVVLALHILHAGREAG